MIKTSELNKTMKRAARLARTQGYKIENNYYPFNGRILGYQIKHNKIILDIFLHDPGAWEDREIFHGNEIRKWHITEEDTELSTCHLKDRLESFLGRFQND